MINHTSKIFQNAEGLYELRHIFNPANAQISRNQTEQLIVYMSDDIEKVRAAKKRFDIFGPKGEEIE